MIELQKFCGLFRPSTGERECLVVAWRGDKVIDQSPDEKVMRERYPEAVMREEEIRIAPNLLQQFKVEVGAPKPRR